LANQLSLPQPGGGVRLCPPLQRTRITASLGIILLGCFVLKANAACIESSQDMVNQINRYRGLKVTCDGTLAYLAYQHTIDQQAHYDSGSNGQTLYNDNCNVHSWKGYNSKKGSCCFTSSFTNNQCMWDAGDKISGNVGNVFEISVGPDNVGNYNDVTFNAALNSWVGSGAHNEVLQGTGQWTFLTKAGCYYTGKYANCYFQ